MEQLHGDQVDHDFLMSPLDQFPPDKANYFLGVASTPGQLFFENFQEACATKWQKFPGSRKPMPLEKLALFTSVMASGGCALVYYLIQKNFSRASYYQLALEQLHSCPEAPEALGTPLNIHYLQLSDKYHFVDIADVQLKIPVSRSKSEGYLYVSSSRDALFKRWHLQGVFLELKNGQQIPLFEHSGENGNEVKKGLNVTKKTQFSPGIAFPHHYILSMASSQFSSYPGG
ncbi:cytochrome c oxidase assembly factor 1 homolog [Rousettus aegyptiacus]|uniref:cytochrome c oxidase assembly factor 1 homolog n=1 Tax=Rousettus aegyptiacus TaxID=9407 RepID=UPI000788FB3E|nr:cytochrome c oxidase assembly factor 1 homolog [Rousettus aegyptiacus]